MAERTQSELVVRVIQQCGAWAGNRHVAWLGLVLVCLVVSITVMRPVINPDLGWHLALGRYIAETGSIPDQEIFTHTAAGAPMVAHEWLSQLISFLVAQSFGVLGVRWLHAALACALLLIVFVWLRRDGVSPALALLGVVGYAIVAQPRFQIRPHMFYLVLYVLLYGYLFIRRPPLKPPELAGIFVATVLWANMHSAVLILPALVWLYIGVEFLQQLSGWRAPRPSDLGQGKRSRLLLLGLLVGLGSMATPHNIALIPYVLESVRINSGISTEWKSITSFWGESGRISYYVEAFWILFGATFILAARGWRRVSCSEVAVVLVIACMPLSGQRHLGACFAPVLFVFGELDRWLRDSSSTPSGINLQRIASLIALASVLILSVWALMPPSGLGFFKNLPSSRGNFRQDMFPLGAVRLMRQLELKSRLYHPGRWGGYIEWEAYGLYPTFSDGRWVTIGREVIDDDDVISYRLPEAFEKLDQYGIDLMLLPRGWMTPKVRKEQRWLTLFENVNAGLYLRHGPDTEADLKRVQAYYDQWGVPFDSDLGFEEKRAFEANRAWADRFAIKRIHYYQFRMGMRQLQRSPRGAKGW